MITPEHEKARRLEAIKRHLGEGGSIASAARELGCKPGTLSEWTRSSLGVNNSRDLAVQTAMDAVGTGLVPHSMWTKVPPKDGEPGFSVYHKIEQPPEDVAERIRAALEGLTPAAPVIAPESVMADLCAVYPLMDAHVGMQAWGKETGGQDYDLTLAAQDMRQAFAKVLALTPAAEKAVLLIGGDYFHSDDTRAETPASKHKLDMDGRFHKVLDVGIAIIAETVDRLLAKHASVTVRVLRGNHDPHSHLVLTLGSAIAWNPAWKWTSRPVIYSCCNGASALYLRTTGTRASRSKWRCICQTFARSGRIPVTGTTLSGMCITTMPKTLARCAMKAFGRSAPRMPTRPAWDTAAGGRCKV
jgi:hypothetical protein